MILRPPLLAIGAAGSALYRVFFAKSDLRSAINREKELEADIAKIFHFLVEGGVEFVGRDPSLLFPPPFDYASTIAIHRNVKFRFIRGRGEERVDLRTTCADELWCELSLILSLLDIGEQVPRGSIQDFRRAASLVQAHLDDIEDALCSTHSLDFARALNDALARDSIIARQTEIELNRRLYEQ